MLLVILLYQVEVMESRLVCIRKCTKASTPRWQALQSSGTVTGDDYHVTESSPPGGIVYTP